MKAYAIILTLNLVGFFLCGGSVCSAAGTDDLNSAFLATFGKAAPIERHVDEQIRGAAGPEVYETKFVLAPQFLVPLGGGKYSLIVSETTDSTLAGHASSNAVSVAYLSQIGGAWAVEHVWLEVGGIGFAGNATSEVKSFGAEPLYFSTHHWCGFNSCSDLINVLVLQTAGPKVLGKIKGGAVFPVIFPDAMPTDCDSTDYAVHVGPPSSVSALFGVTYEGWTAPSGRLLPKRRFRRAADVIEKGGQLETGLQTPDCMR
jgi:hypothetical protein